MAHSYLGHYKNYYYITLHIQGYDYNNNKLSH